MDKSTTEVAMMAYGRQYITDNHISAGIITPTSYDGIPYTYISWCTAKIKVGSRCSYFWKNTVLGIKACYFSAYSTNIY